MAKKTDAEIGKQIRDMISAITLGDKEIIDNISVIVNVIVKNTESGNVYGKASKGIEIQNCNKDNENIASKW